MVEVNINEDLIKLKLSGAGRNVLTSLKFRIWFQSLLIWFIEAVDWNM